MKISIQSIHFSADQKLLELVEKKVSKLEQFYNRIIDAEVFLKIENQSSNIKDKTVEVKVNLPGQQFFSKGSGKLFEQAVDEAVDSMRRQVKKHKEKIRA